jgi:hypothetical protein
MRQGQHQQQKRMRGRSNHSGGNNNRKGPNPLSRSYESNGPDVKIRGTAAHIADKYVQLSRDALSSGDQVAAESYLQHAEHYYRILAAAQPQFQQHLGFVRADEEPRDEEFDEETGEPIVQQPVEGGDGRAQGFNGQQPQQHMNGSRDNRGEFNNREREPREFRENREPRQNREPREARDYREPREGGEAREMREPREPREPRDGREPREAREGRPPREPRNRDFNGRAARPPREGDEEIGLPAFITGGGAGAPPQQAPQADEFVTGTTVQPEISVAEPDGIGADADAAESEARFAGRRRRRYGRGRGAGGEGEGASAPEPEVAPGE